MELSTIKTKYFELIIPDAFTEDDIDIIRTEANTLCCSDNEALNEVLAALKDSNDKAQDYLCAMTVMACLSVKLVNPIFARTDAIGTVMRKKIKPVTDSILEQLQILRN